MEDRCIICNAIIPEGMQICRHCECRSFEATDKSLKKTLSNTKKIVTSILEDDEKARNCDSYLYLKVIERLAPEKGYEPTIFMEMPVSYFLSNMQNEGFPLFETVRRTRQKVQAECPHLAACRKVKAFREENEEIFREFAKEH